jgi:Carboxypeptidase regulatory-like domain
MLRHVYLITALVAVVSPFTCLGQGWTFYTPSGRITANQPVSQNRYKITGTVVNSATGEPIVRALVRVNGPTSQQVFTDGNGRFEMSDVPEGQIVVTAQRPGFINNERSNQQRPRMVTVGPSTPSIEVRLVPEGAIKGKITDRDGEPVEGIGIQVMLQQVNNGRKDWLPHGGAQTDENGEYLVEGLPPGQYLVRTSTRPLFPMRVAAETSPVNEVYPAQYFPNAPGQENAQPVTVQPGQVAESDFRLSPVPSYSISGTVSGPLQNTEVACEDTEGNLFSFGRANRRTGQFRLTHVPSGSCTLIVRSQGPNGQAYLAEQPVTVNSSNITNVQLILQPLPDIPVHFSNSSGGIPVQLQLVSRQKHWRGSGQFSPTMQSGSPDGQTPVFKSVPPGSYKVVSYGFGNQCVGSLSSGGTDLLREDLTVMGGSAQTAPIEVSLRSDCATLTGTMNANSPGLDIAVLVMPGSAGMEPKLIHTLGGNFSFAGLTPGEYTVYAFSDVSDLEYANPESLREFSGQKVTLGPSEKATVQLNLIARGDSK